MTGRDWKQYAGVFHPGVDSDLPHHQYLTTINEPWVWFSRCPVTVQGVTRRVLVMVQVGWDEHGVTQIVGIRTPAEPLTEEMLRALPLRDLREQAGWMMGDATRLPTLIEDHEDDHPSWNFQPLRSVPRPNRQKALRDREDAIKNLWSIVVADIRDYRHEPSSPAYLERVALLSREAQRWGLPMTKVVAAAAQVTEAQAEKHRRWAREAGFDTGYTAQEPKTTRNRGGTKKKGTTK